MKKLLLASALVAALFGSMIPYAQAAPAAKGKKAAKSAVKGKKKAKSPALTAEKAKALLKKKGITPDKYESAFQAAVTTPEEYGHFSLLLAAGVDASTPRTWEKLPELAGEYLSDAAKEQLKQEYTPLTVALLLSNERVARKLIALPASNAKNWSPLEVAIIKGDDAQIKSLLDSGANPFARGTSGTLPVCLAAILGRKSTIMALYNHEKSAEKAKAADKNALLSHLEKNATYMGHTRSENNDYLQLSRAESAAEFRIALYTPTFKWDTPEDWPLWKEVFIKLTFIHADLHTYHSRTIMRTFLKEAKTGLQEAYYAVINNNVKQLKKALESADKKALDGEMRSLAPVLAYAIATHHHECLKILLDAGLDPDVQTAGSFNGVAENMLMIAYNSRNMKAFKLLIEKGADISAEADHGSTIIDCLFGNQDKETIDYVLSQSSFKEETVHPLMLALMKDDYAKIEELMSASTLEPVLSAWDWRTYFEWAIARKDARALGLIYHSSLSDTSKCTPEMLNEIKKLSEDPAFKATNK